MNTPFKSEAGRAEIVRRYRAGLADWPVPATERTVDTPFGETFVLVSGPADAPPVVLLHGSSANALNWQGDVAAWSRRFRVYAVDELGEPGLSAPHRPRLDSPDCAAWLGAVLDGLCLDRVSLVGESLGGWFALDYATRNPGRVAALALLCPGGIGRQRREHILLAVALLFLGPWGRRASVRWLLGADLAAIPDWVISVQRHFRPRLETLPRFGGDRLARLTMPVLAVVGARDHMLDSAGTARGLAAVGDATVVVLPDAGHLLPRQTERIADFLAAAAG